MRPRTVSGKFFARAGQNGVMRQKGQMTTLVETCWGPRPIEDQPYWHMVGTPWPFYNNVRVGKGALLSANSGVIA